MASGALPPGFPAVEIEGEYYWDGGLVSNTPLALGRRDASRGATRWLSRSTSGAHAANFPATSVRCHDAGKGNPLFQPHPRRH